MTKYKDREGAEWEISLTAASVRRVFESCKVDLRDPLGGAVATILADSTLAVRVLFAAVAPQAKDRDVDADKFDALHGGDAIDSGVRALLDEIPSFFPSAVRSDYREAIAKVAEMRGAAVAEMMAQMKALDPAKVIREAMNEANGAADAVVGKLAARVSAVQQAGASVVADALNA